MPRESKLPKRLQPMLATLTDAPFDDPAWVFESKPTRHLRDGSADLVSPTTLTLRAPAPLLPFPFLPSCLLAPTELCARRLGPLIYHCNAPTSLERLDRPDEPFHCFVSLSRRW
jgi:hypothetical protein